MRTALGIVYVVAKSEYIFLKFVHVLESNLYAYVFALALYVYRLVNRFFIFIYLFNKSDYSVRLVICDFYLVAVAQIDIFYREIRIKICCFVKSAFHLCRCEARFFEDFGIGLEVYLCTRLLCFTKYRQQSFFELCRRLAALVAVGVYIAVSAYFYGKMFRKCIYDRRTYAVQTAARLIRCVVEFAAGMKCCKYKSLCRHTFFVHAYGYAPAVVLNRARSVRLKRYPYKTAKSRQVFIHGVIYYFIY